MADFTKQEVEDKLVRAGQRLIESQPDLFSFTNATRQSEWNLARHFANELHKEFPDYRCDTDVIKAGHGNMRPDVIIHKRGTHKHNLLVVQVKRIRADVKDDITKTTTHSFSPPLRYQFGAVVVISNSEPPFIVLLQNAATN